MSSEAALLFVINQSSIKAMTTHTKKTHGKILLMGVIINS